MADEVSVNTGDNKSEIAYKMAFQLWVNEHERHPKLSDQEDFLNLVQECARALTPGRRAI